MFLFYHGEDMADNVEANYNSNKITWLWKQTSVSLKASVEWDIWSMIPFLCVFLKELENMDPNKLTCKEAHRTEQH